MLAGRRVANRARRPDVVASLVAGTAFVFSTLYLWAWPAVANWVNGVPPIALVPLISLNAFLATKLVWTSLVGDSKPLSQRRLAVVGLLIGLLSHVGLGFITGTAYLLFDENGLLVEGLPSLAEVPHLVAVWIGMPLFTGFYSTFLTFGNPFLLSLAVSVSVARAHDKAW